MWCRLITVGRMFVCATVCHEIVQMLQLRNFVTAIAVAVRQVLLLQVDEVFIAQK